MIRGWETRSMVYPGKGDCMKKWWEIPYLLLSDFSQFTYAPIAKIERPISAWLRKRRGEKEPRELVKLLGDENGRDASEKRLVELGPEVANPLFTALRSKDENVWKTASRIIVKKHGMIGIERIAGELRHTNRQYRERVVAVLAGIGEPAVPVLGKMLGEEDTLVGGGAVWALGEIGGTAVPFLVGKVLDQDEDLDVRFNAATALGKTKDARGAPALVKCLGKTGNDWRLRSVATDALVIMGRPAAPFLVKAMGDKNYEIYYHAAEALARIGGDAEDAIREVLKSRQIRRPATNYLIERITDPRLAGALVEELGENWGIYSTGHTTKMINALRKMGRKSLEELLEGAESKNKARRINCIGLLGELTDKKAVQLLSAALKDEDSSIRAAAGGALQYHGFLLDRETRVRASLCSGSDLRLMRKKDTPHLLKMMDGGRYKKVRDNAKGAFREMKRPDSNYLVGILENNPDNSLRVCAAEALGLIEKRAGAGPLARALDSDDPKLRKTALWALGKIYGAPEAAPKLIELMKNRDKGYPLDDIPFMHDLVKAIKASLLRFEIKKTGAGNLASGLRKEATIEIMELVMESEEIQLESNVRSLLNKNYVKGECELEQMKMDAIQALGKIGDSETVPVLLEIFESKPELGIYAASAIMKIPDSSGRRIGCLPISSKIINVVESKDERYDLETLIGMLGKTLSNEWLSGFDSSETEGMRRKASIILGGFAIGEEEERQYVFVSRNAKDVKNECGAEKEAIWAIGEIGHPEAIPMLLKIIEIRAELAKTAIGVVSKMEVNMQTDAMRLELAMQRIERKFALMRKEGWLEPEMETLRELHREWVNGLSKRNGEKERVVIAPKTMGKVILLGRKGK